MVSQFDYTTLENYDKTEFEIKGTKLVKYTGKNKKVKVPEGVTSIGAEAFKDCDWITEIYIPYGVEEIDYSAFNGCNSIREVEIPIRALKENADVIKYFGERYKEIEYGLSCGDSEDFPRLRAFFDELDLQQYKQEKKEGINLDINFEEEDPLIKDALNLYLTEMLVTDLSLSKKLHISSDRASDIIKFLEKNRFIGPRENMSVVRKVYITADIYKSLFGEEPCAVEAPKEEEDPIEQIEQDFDPEFIKEVLGFVVRKDRIIYTLLQRKFKITYKSAGRILELFEHRGYVGKEQGSGWRDVFATVDVYKDLYNEEPPIDYVHSEFEIDGTVLTKYKGKGGEVVIPQGVTAIDNAAFLFCGELTDAKIPNSVEAIGDGAFMQCGGLRNINIPESVKTIGTRAFEGCYLLKVVDIPKSVTLIEANAFNSEEILEIKVEEGNPIYHSENNCLIETASKTMVLGCRNSLIPSDGSVEIIGKNAFYCCHELSNVEIPNSIISIEEGAFTACRGLTKITIPDSVKSIGAEAFRGCSGIAELIIPNSVMYVGERAFSSCGRLESIKLTRSISEIPQGLFQKCVSLKSFIVTDNITSIGNEAFEECENLSAVIIPDSVTSIGEKAFHLCKNLYGIELPNSIESIGRGAFFGCSNLSKFVFPEKITQVEQDIFQRCTNLTEVVLHSGITSIGQMSFAGCINLQNIILPEGIKLIGWLAFNYCKALKEMIIPENVVLISSSAFLDCDNLQKVTLPKRLVEKEGDLKSYFGERYRKIEYTLTAQGVEPEILLIPEEDKAVEEEKESNDIPSMKFDINFAETDPLLKEALRIIIKSQKVSAAEFQRRFAIGYNRAIRLINLMEEHGFIGKLDKDNNRKIYITEQTFKFLFREDL